MKYLAVLLFCPFVLGLAMLLISQLPAPAADVQDWGNPSPVEIDDALAGDFSSPLSVNLSVNPTQMTIAEVRTVITELNIDLGYAMYYRNGAETSEEEEFWDYHFVMLIESQITYLEMWAEVGSAWQVPSPDWSAGLIE